ncbi:hypothetical protein [Eubacterium sp.]|uniref:hypothetical protein n=1 Tax=Eubacterium sp. TaxID=142586 RepID=UPI0025CC1CFD|nr:hypothetical protein [Eubacterium sp.]MCR5629913.1 hypothetical protein [Eubacterium sp.]
MKYIIMCGGEYKGWEHPRHLSVVNGETLLERTIGLLILNDISHKDIYVSTNNPEIEKVAEKNLVKVVHHENNFTVYEYNNNKGYWCTAFYIKEFYTTKEPVTYLFGDVYYTPDAIETIINKPVDRIEFFASKPPFSKYYIKEWAEPFALKVYDIDLLVDSILKCIEYADQGKFKRQPIMWELWQVIKGHELNCIDYNSYTPINDCTCDIDSPGDIKKLEAAVGEYIKHS